MDAADEAAVTEQLGRAPRGVVGIAWRCATGEPGVVVTEPRLPDGTPFPTTYYLTCPRLGSAVSTLEANGVMTEMTARLDADAELAEDHRRAHLAYRADRAELGRVDELEGISAGWMPSRVKCLHVLVGHSLAVGPGVNRLGDEAVAQLVAVGVPCLAGR